MSEASGVTPLYVLYSGLTRLAAPLVLRHVGKKLSAQGVAADRIQERAGHATLPRPNGTVIWFHGASVGESLSVLSIISHLGKALPDVEFLITSGTAAAAEIVSKRLPPRTRHQFAPLDAPQILDRFLDHWEPAAGVFVESELWPGMLLRARDRGVRLALLNARLSQKSAQGWARYPDTARLVLGAFDLLLTQNGDIADRLRMMGADEAKLRTGANLKATAAPLPVESGTLDALQRDLEGRPFWAASSTHPGEDEIVLQAQIRILTQRPEAVLLLIPRHPDRGDAIQDLIQSHGLICSRRSTGTAITGDTQVYLADTLGETGTWYAAAPIVLLGGSLLPEIGGHNPFEPAQSGAAVLTGPYVENFQETFPPMIAAGAATETAGPAEIAAQIGAWLDDPEALSKARARSRAFARAQADQLDDVLDQLILALGLTPT